MQIEQIGRPRYAALLVGSITICRRQHHRPDLILAADISSRRAYFFSPGEAGGLRIAQKAPNESLAKW